MTTQHRTDTLANHHGPIVAVAEGVERFDLKTILLRFFQDLLANSRVTLNGNSRTVQFEYNGHGKHIRISSATTETEYLEALGEE